MTSRIAVVSSDAADRLSRYADAPDRNASAARSGSSFIVRNTSLTFAQLLLDLAPRFETVQERHRDVEHDDIGLQRLGGGHQRPSVGHLADDLALAREQFLERAEQQRVIVRQQDSGTSPSSLLYRCRGPEFFFSGDATGRGVR